MHQEDPGSCIFCYFYLFVASITKNLYIHPLLFFGIFNVYIHNKISAVCMLVVCKLLFFF